MNFIVDAQLPRVLAKWLESAGNKAIHTLELPHGNRTGDSEIARVADAMDAVVVTKDADFVISHVVSKVPARLLLISTGNITNPELAALIKANLATIIRALESAAFVELSPTGIVERT